MIDAQLPAASVRPSPLGARRGTALGSARPDLKKASRLFSAPALIAPPVKPRLQRGSEIVGSAGALETANRSVTPGDPQPYLSRPFQSEERHPIERANALSMLPGVRTRVR